MQEKHSRTVRRRTVSGIGVFAAILMLCELASLAVLFSRMITYSQAEFVNVMPLIDESEGVVTSVQTETVPTAAAPAADSSDTTGFKHHPEFRMEADAEIFRFTYDNDGGKITVNGGAENDDKLIAPGTTNLYQFTLANPGDVALDYHLTMEAYVTGTDLWIPVNARVWDYTNKYLVGGPEQMVDVMELNTVDESAELGAGRNAVYNLEWEWPFERADENGDITLNDQYDTMLGNMAVDDDLVLHIVIRTVAEYDEDPDDPNAGLIDPPKTGEESRLSLFVLLGAASLFVLLIILVADRRSKRGKDGGRA